MLFALLVFIVVVLAILYFLANYRTPLVDESRKDLLRCQTKEVANYQLRAGETAPRRHVLFPELLVTKGTVFQRLIENCNKYKNLPCLGSRKIVRVHQEKRLINGVEKDWEFLELSPYQWLSYSEVYQTVLNVGSGLRNLGLKPKENFGIFEETRAEWTLACQACFSQSIPVVTVYSNLGLDGLVFALNEGEIHWLLANGKSLKSILAEKTASKLPFLKGVIYTDSADADVLKKCEEAGIKAIAFDDVAADGKKNPVEPAIPKPEDMAVIMYTSGSTGTPKGVMLSHTNILSAVDGGYKSITVHVDENDVYISYLPLAHILALVVENLCLSRGIAIGYGNPRSLIDSEVRNCLGDLRELRPTIMAGVPTVFDKVKKGAMDKIAKAPPVAKKLFHYAFQQKKVALQQGKDTPFWNALVFNKIKAQVGGRIRFILSGGAPLSKETHEFLRVALTPFTGQGYGLTETCGGATAMFYDDLHSYQTVGAPFACAEIKLVDAPELNYRSTDKPHPRGEIFIRGAHISMGYYKNPEKTKEEFHEDGWFSSGDIGQWLGSGALQIIDRKKNIVKLSHGEYIALEYLESIYKNSPLVDNICVCANSSEQFCVALIVPSKKNLPGVLKIDNITDEVLHKKETRDAVHASLLKVAQQAKLKTVEIPKFVFLCPEEWTPENGLMTAAMKIKRIDLNKKFGKEIARMYSHGHH